MFFELIIDFKIKATNQPVRIIIKEDYYAESRRASPPPKDLNSILAKIISEIVLNHENSKKLAASPDGNHLKLLNRFQMVPNLGVLENNRSRIK